MLNSLIHPDISENKLVHYRENLLLSPDNKWVVYADVYKYHVIIFDNQTGEVFRQREEYSGTPHFYCFSDDSQHVCYLNNDQHTLYQVTSMIRWNFVNDTYTKCFPGSIHHDSAYVETTPDLSRALTAGEESHFGVWDLEQGEMLWKLGNHKDRVIDIKISADGLLAVSLGDMDKTACLWDLKCGQLADTIKMENAGKAVNFVDLSTAIISDENDREYRLKYRPDKK